jgi:type II secretory pathway pseudopilin PulG
MNLHPTNKPKSSGSSLIETVIAMSVLAVAIPLVFVALAESGKSSSSAEFETRSSQIIAACMAEIRASREGNPAFFTKTKVAETFPPPSDLWALAFSSLGEPIAKLTRSEYEKGLKEINGTPARYLTTLSSHQITEQGVTPIISRISITLEYPSIAPVSKRQKLTFYSLVL